ncbi:MAG: hypothetical protein HY683_10500 [Chloroflexi bacterium]|nr:hypothetical protein [Chloroflexota bacterium]
MGQRRVLLASTNPAKRAKLRWLVAGLGLEVEGPDASIAGPALDEAGRSHRENAALKAVAWSRAYPGLTIASDGGLVIPALLGRWNSLRTSRFAGPGASDVQRADALLRLAQSLSGDERTAHWEEAVAVASQGLLLKTFSSRSGPGLLLAAPPSGGLVPGFWAASLWHFPSLGKTYVRLTARELRQIGDHWSKLRPRVRRYLRRVID